MEPEQPTVAISLTVKDSSAALDFYTRAFGARELFRMPLPGGGIAHAEFQIGNTRIYMSDEDSDWHARAMPEGTMASCLLTIETDDCDAAHRRAVEAGAESLNEPADQFWGIRSAMVRDPFGYRWGFGQKTEDLSPEEVIERARRFMGG